MVTDAALEVSDAASPYANFVHIYTRSGKAPSVSWESHYVGSVRGIRASHLDGFLLKSLDFINLPASHFIDPEGMLISPCGEGAAQRCIFRLSNKGEIVQLGQWNEADPKHHELLAGLKKDAAENPELIDPKMGGESSVLVPVEGVSAAYTGDGRYAHGERMWLMQRGVFERLASAGHGELMPLLTHVHMNNWHGNPARKPYDVIVRALGWKQNLTVYADSVNPAMDQKGGGTKYALMTPEWESVNERNLFFGGALGHGLDWRKSSGGFIHGFRYTARALSHVLESRLYATPWPHRTFDIPLSLGSTALDQALTEEDVSVVNTVAAAFTDRIAEAAGPYQMFGMLSDGMVFCNSGSGVRAVYIEELPTALFDANWGAYPRILWAFRYARPKVTLAEVAEHGTSFGPFVWAWHCGSGVDGDAACGETRAGHRRMKEKQMADASELGMAAPMITNPFEDMSVGLGEHGVFDDKFSFGEDPHTEFNQLDDARTFRMWVRETVSAVLGRAGAAGESLPSCDAVWDASSWNTVERPVVGGGGGSGKRKGGGEKKRRRTRRSKSDDL